MAIFAHSLNEPFAAECLGGAVSLGNFDGVHRGHQALIGETVRQARLVKGPAVAVTFDPPPARFLRPDSCQPLLTPVSYRGELLQNAGADHVIVFQTSPAILELTARDFFDRILVSGLRTKAVVEGFNFAFGKNRVGTGALLQTWGSEAGMTISLLDAQLHGDQPISSSRVRAKIVAGDPKSAAELLGRPYRLFGNVGLGNQRGRTLGFPTANLTKLENLVPGPGVYAARVPYQGKIWNAATHIGPRPTFADASPTVEVHLIGFAGDLYGKDLAVDIVAKVRDPRPFASVQELVEQIQKDIAAIEIVLSG